MPAQTQDTVINRRSIRSHRAAFATIGALPILAGLLAPWPAGAAVAEECPKPQNVSLTLAAPSTLDVTWEWPADVPIFTHVVTINEDPYDIGSDNPAYTGVTTDTHWSFNIDWTPGKEYEVSVTTSCNGISTPSTSIPATITVPLEAEEPSEPEVPTDPEVPIDPEVPSQPQTPVELEDPGTGEAPVRSAEGSASTKPTSTTASELAETGAYSWPGATFGALLVAAGALTLRVRRRRALAPAAD